MKKLIYLWLACGLAPILSAQQATPPVLPPGPLLNKAPDFAQWTITTRPNASVSEDAGTPDAQTRPDPSPSPTAHHRPKAVEADAKKPAAPPEQTTVVTKTQSIRHEETSEGKEPKMQKWCVVDMQVTLDGSATPVVSLPGNSIDSNYVDYSRSDFPGFEWIAEHNFTGTRKVLGQDCLIFEDKVQPGKKGTAPMALLSEVASINAATRLPVALQIEDATQTYVFGLAPTAMLTLPPEVQAVVEQWRKTMSQAALMPAKP